MSNPLLSVGRGLVDVELTALRKAYLLLNWGCGFKFDPLLFVEGALLSRPQAGCRASGAGAMGHGQHQRVPSWMFKAVSKWSGEGKDIWCYWPKRMVFQGHPPVSQANNEGGRSVQCPRVFAEKSLASRAQAKPSRAASSCSCGEDLSRGATAGSGVRISSARIANIRLRFATRTTTFDNAGNYGFPHPGPLPRGGKPLGRQQTKTKKAYQAPLFSNMGNGI